MIRDSQAIVLKSIHYGDTSLIIKIFTDKYGKQTLLSKGARKQKNSMFSILEPANYLYTSYYNKNTRTIQILKEASYVMHFHNIRKSYKKIQYTLAVIEIIDKTYLNDYPSPIIFRLLVQYLNKINRTNDMEYIYFTFFLLHFSIQMGFKPELKNCYKCQIILKDYFMESITGQFICNSCNQQNNTSKKFDQKTILLIITIMNTHIDKLNKINLSGFNLNNINFFLDNYLNHHIYGMNYVNSMKEIRRL
tara:strand:+ start:585 stop:1331 length:747 start_codon:yes stop_codon:yes gene_type:complete